jgi:hypothetical protein
MPSTVWKFASDVECLAQAASTDRPIGRRGRGKPVDEMGRWLVRHLADLYERATGSDATRMTDPYTAGAPRGRFFEFVRYVYKWIGAPYADKTDVAIDGDIRRYAGCFCDPAGPAFSAFGCSCVRRWTPIIAASIEADRRAQGR